MSSTPAHHYDPYDRLAPFYDWMARTLLLPFGGEGRFRRQALAPLGLRPGMRVLELGCGTGSMTRLLLQAGAEVTSVDLSRPMLARAARKAPGAAFVEADILGFRGEQPFDRVLLCFVLHEMGPEIRAAALEAAAANLGPDGLLGVVDFSDGAPFPVRPLFRAYLRLVEPEVALGMLQGLRSEVAGRFDVLAHHRLALGTAQVIAARPAPG
jgi:demethylmenaquinone methyltransferase/2-methoxy-6-polyprenyl-1,4-benzoquinol methylase